MAYKIQTAFSRRQNVYARLVHSAGRLFSWRNPAGASVHLVGVSIIIFQTKIANRVYLYVLYYIV